MLGSIRHVLVPLCSTEQLMQSFLLFLGAFGGCSSAVKGVRAPARILLLSSGRSEDVGTTLHCTYCIRYKMKRAGSIALNTRDPLLPALAASLNSPNVWPNYLDPFGPSYTDFFPSRFLLFYEACNYDNWTLKHCGSLQKMNQCVFFLFGV